MKDPRFALVAAAVFATLGSLRAQGLTNQVFTGHIIDEAGKPLAGAGVAAGREPELLTRDALEKPAARADRDGRFTVTVDRSRPGSGAQPRTLLFAHPGKIAMVLGYVPEENTPSAPATIELGAIALPSGATLRGKVLDADGKPLAGARVASTDLVATQNRMGMEGATWSAFSAAVTDERGMFALACAPASAAALVFSKPGWYEAERSPVGIETPLTVTLQPSGFVTGRVVDASGKPWGTWLTVAYEAGDGRQAATADDGTFRIPVARPGRFRISSIQGAAAQPRCFGPILAGPASDVVVRRWVRPGPGDPRGSSSGRERAWHSTRPSSRVSCT